MKPAGNRHKTSLAVVVEAARSLPELEQSTTWDAEALKAGGRLLACRATHKSAEPGSIVVKVPIDQRDELIASDPDVYYVTDHYVNYPSVLVRLSRIHRDALRDLLAMAWTFANAGKRKPAGRRKRSPRS